MLAEIKTKLNKKTQLTHDVWLYNFSPLGSSELIFTPGQYLILPVKKTNGEIINRLYSIASPANQKNSFDLLIRLIPNGLASTFFSSLQSNDEVDFLGPAGVFSVKNHNRSLVFLATGTGLAPIRSILLSLLPTINHSAFLLWGISKKEDIYLLDELRGLSQKYKNFDFKICLSKEASISFAEDKDQGRFLIGRVYLGLESPKLKQNLINYDFYLCGSREIVDSLKNNLLALGISPDNIFFERF